MNILTLFILLGAFFKLNAVEPYDSITDLPFDSHGWFGNGTKLEKIINEKRPQIVIEVGSWLGLSTRFIAGKVAEGAKVYAVDTWRGSPGESVHLQDPRLPYLYQQFLSNVKHAGLTDKIIPVRMDSLEAARALNIQADLIYIDGFPRHSQCDRRYHELVPPFKNRWSDVRRRLALGHCSRCGAELRS